jgi:hypothetical protein
MKRSMNTKETPARGAMWIELGALLAVIVGERLVDGAVHGVLGLVLGVAALAVLVTFFLRCGLWAERISRQKGVYHPQYFVLGPIGLVMALCARTPRPREVRDRDER